MADPAFCKGGFIGLLVFFIHHCKWFTEIQCLQCCIKALYGASVLCQAQKKKKIHTFVILLGRALIYRSMYMQCFSMQSLFLSTKQRPHDHRTLMQAKWRRLDICSQSCRAHLLVCVQTLLMAERGLQWKPPASATVTKPHVTMATHYM